MIIVLFLFMCGVCSYIMLKPLAHVEAQPVKVEQSAESMMDQLQISEARTNA